MKVRLWYISEVDGPHHPYIDDQSGVTWMFRKGFMRATEEEAKQELAEAATALADWKLEVSWEEIEIPDPK